MASSLDSSKHVIRWVFIYSLMGNLFLKVRKFCGFVFKYILGKDVADDEIDKLIIESKNLEHFHSHGIANFSDFNEICLRDNVPISSIFVSNFESCRKCGRKLLLDTNWKCLTVYHATRGTYIGSRMTKRCGKCRLYEHYGFWTESGMKMFDDTFYNKEFLLSTEDTAIDMNIIKYFKREFVMGATSFKMKAAVYNNFHGYAKENDYMVGFIDTVLWPRQHAHYQVQNLNKSSMNISFQRKQMKPNKCIFKVH